MDEGLSIVRVLTGPHEGAEMEIPLEGIIIGSDELCDLILFSSQVVSQHVRLIPENRGVVLQPLHGVVLLDGVTVKEKVKLNDSKQLITIGDTYLAVGYPGEEWPVVSLKSGNQNSNLPLLTKDTSASTTQKTFPVKKTKISVPLSILIGSVLFIITYVTLKNLGREIEATAQAAAAPSSVKSLEKLRSKCFVSTSPIVVSNDAAIDPNLFPLEAKVATKLSQELGNVALSMRKEGKKSQLTVWVRGGAESATARKIINQFSPPLSCHVLDLAQIETSAATLAQLAGLSLQVQIEPKGAAFWSGYLQNDRRWQNFCRHIAHELPIIHNHRCKILFGNQLIKLLQRELRQYGLKIQPVAAENGILLVGTVPKVQKVQLASWIAKIRERYSAQVSIIDKVDSSTIVQVFSRDFFPARIIGICGKATSWIALADGSKLFPGSKLKNGYLLEEIHASMLLLNGPEGQFQLPLSTLH